MRPRTPTISSARPEGELAIAEAVIYVATAPKSNAAYVAFGAAMRTAKEAGSLLPPKHILNAPTKLMKSEGYGSGYEYDHDAPEAFSGQDYFPEALGRQQLLRSARARLRARNPEAAGILGEAAAGAGWGVMGGWQYGVAGSRGGGGSYAARRMGRAKRNPSSINADGE